MEENESKSVMEARFKENEASKIYTKTLETTIRSRELSQMHCIASIRLMPLSHLINCRTSPNARNTEVQVHRIRKPHAKTFGSRSN